MSGERGGQGIAVISLSMGDWFCLKKHPTQRAHSCISPFHKRLRNVKMAAYAICWQQKNFQSFTMICRKPHMASSICLHATSFQNPVGTLWTHCTSPQWHTSCRVTLQSLLSNTHTLPCLSYFYKYVYYTLLSLSLYFRPMQYCVICPWPLTKMLKDHSIFNSICLAWTNLKSALKREIKVPKGLEVRQQEMSYKHYKYPLNLEQLLCIMWQAVY
jgi:hypothetical protein